MQGVVTDTRQQRGKRRDRVGIGRLGRGFTRGVCIAPSHWSVSRPEAVGEMNGGRNELRPGAAAAAGERR